MNLLAVGTVAFDDVETPHGARRGILGGSATFFSFAASFFTSVGLVGAVGEDFPREHVDLLAGRGIDVSGLRVVPGEKTFHWSGRYAGAMNEAETLDTRLNVLEGYVPVLPEEHKRTPFVFLANAEPRLQLEVIARLEKPRFLVLDTMNLWIDTALKELKEVLGLIDGLVINEGEATMLSGERNTAAAARAVREMGPRTVIVKRGEYGSYLHCDEGRFAIPAFPLEAVVDPTGAGDSFAGGFMGHLASGGTVDFGALKKAMAYGTVTASFAVEDFSLGRFVRLERDEIDRRFEEFIAFTRF